jgi:hypothetical protein
VEATRGHLSLEERKQILVDLVLEGRAHSVLRTRIDLQRSAFDDFGREQSRGADRYDLVVVSMNYESGDIESLEIFREVRL